MKTRCRISIKCLLTGVLSLALLPMACQKKAPIKKSPPVRDYHQEAEALFDSGDYAQAASLYEHYLSQPAPKQQTQALFRLALIHALPDSPLYEPQRATQLFQQLLRLSPPASLVISRFPLPGLTPAQAPGSGRPSSQINLFKPVQL